MSCQSKGVKVLLSIGGTFSGNYKLSSASDAQDVAAYLWNNFLGGTSAVPRPLGNASLDGIDFEVENGLGIEYYDDLAKNPVTLFDGATAGRKYMLTAAPTYCPYSGQTLDRVLRTGLFDHVWVKFYDSFVCESAVGNYSTLWSEWQRWTSALPSYSWVWRQGPMPPSPPTGS